MSKRARVLLADDDAAMCSAVTRLLSRSCDVVGDVSNRPALREAITRLHPDVVLLDFSLAGTLSGVELCRDIKALAPDVHVVAFTAYDDPELKIAVLNAGAAAFVWKLHAVRDLVPTIQALVPR